MFIFLNFWMILEKYFPPFPHLIRLGPTHDNFLSPILSLFKRYKWGNALLVTLDFSNSNLLLTSSKYGFPVSGSVWKFQNIIESKISLSSIKLGPENKWKKIELTVSFLKHLFWVTTERIWEIELFASPLPSKVWLSIKYRKDNKN